MFKTKFKIGIVFLIISLFIFAGCSPQVTPAEPAADTSESAEDHDEHGGEDHDDHGDEGHGDEHGDEDHSDEHGDEDHGDEHGDEDHGDEHGDEAHDDHDDEHREHGAHVHGAAELTVALIDGQAEIMLETPAFNLVGFEYAPNTDDEKAAVAAATETLETGKWLSLTDAAGCSLASADVDNTMAEGDHDEEHHDEEGHDEEGEEHHDEEGHDEEGEKHHDEHDGEKETHSSFFVTYTFNCSSLDSLESLDATMLFSSFPNFEEINAQWINDTQQSAATLDKDQPVLSFE